MRVYLDIIFITNFLFDFILLISTSIVLKRKCNILRLILSSLFGSITLISLFIKLTTIELFLLKVIMSISMILIAFPYKNNKIFVKDLVYFYIISIFAGGFIYFINDQLGLKQEGFLFIKNNFKLNFLLLCIFFLLAIYIYIKQSKDLKTRVSAYHLVEVYYKNQKIICNGYVDSANRIYDPYKRRMVHLIYKDIEVDKFIYVPYKTIEKVGLIKCFIANIKLDNKYIYKNQLIGIVNNKFSIDGVDLILHSDLGGIK